jgi:two-component system phosphate regulon sensor histidine kinase PhoR
VDDPGVNRLFLEKAYRNATQLNALLMDLIDISQMEAGELRLSFRYFSVPDFLRDIASEIQPLAEQKQIQLSVQDTPLPFEAYGDRDRLKNVLMNLLSNAIKYTESGGNVWVSYEAGAKSVTISVRDSGVGIAPEDQQRIFERFYRVDKQRSRDVGGTGLGLAIVKHIVEAHGSKMEVSSEQGKGSTFSFGLKAG